MSEKRSLAFSQTINAPVEQAYQAFTSSIALQYWFADFAEIDAREEGRFYAWWNVGYFTSGLITKLKENKRIDLTWHGLGEPEATKVKIKFADEDGKTAIRIKHKGIGKGEIWDKTGEQITDGWETSLANLTSVLETGYDKRIYDQPMLGVITEVFVDEKMAEELNLPVKIGCKISDALDGMGAKAAGLQGNDVLYSINGHELKAFSDFRPALSGIIAGDKVEVVFYRAAEKHSVQMELSGRPKPTVPKTAAELAENAAKVYQQVDKELDAIFAGISEEQAATRPSPEEWSAKEVLAHLIYSERWMHLAITCHTGNLRSGGFSNDLGMHAAIANAYSLDELIAELKRCGAITIEALKALPDDFVADKRRVTVLATYVAEQGFALHTHSHLNQVKAALETEK
jgi:uncharacterized protein YndB with AHSA1/START domain